jgi:zinc D-Ala-D-Ala carboxypeptidase
MNKESLRRKNFAPDDFFVSTKAKELKINNVTDNVNILTCLNKVADKLQEIRDKINAPITINSAYRCPEVNKTVGGSPSSWHQQGLAVDINAKGYTQDQLVKWIRDSKISVDKCFVERGCVHIQFNLNDEKNRNFFGTAELVKGEWKVKLITI